MTDSNPIPAALEMLDYFGIAVFAVSGALVAAEKKQTLVTFIFFAVATGVGGGTGRSVEAAGGSGAGMVRRGRACRLRHLRRGQGARVRGRTGAGVRDGLLTACAGGIIRDVLAGEPSILMRPELYVTAAALAAGLLVLLIAAGLAAPVAVAVAAAAGFALRGLAIARGWSLPVYRG